MNKIIKPILCAATAAMMIANTGAASVPDIEREIEFVKARRDQAHQMAEYVRSYGEDDTHPAIQFAKTKWWEQTGELIALREKYNEAKEQERLEQERLEQERLKQEKLEQERAAKGTYIGRFRISHYCPWACCNGGWSMTATGAPVSPWHTIAVDPGVIRLGSTVHIEGYGDFKAQDTGGAIKGNRIDVCVGSHSEAMRLGVVYKDVYIKGEK